VNGAKWTLTKQLPLELLETSTKIDIDEMVGSSANDKIILQNR
jgi:hypothetical protein